MSIPGYISPFIGAFRHSPIESPEGWRARAVRESLFPARPGPTSFWYASLDKKAKNPYWNCMSSMGSSLVGCGFGTKFVVLDTASMDPVCDHTLPGDILEIVGDCSGVSILRLKDGSLWSCSMESDGEPSRLQQVFSLCKALRMSVTGDKFAVSLKESVGIYDLGSPDLVISDFSDFADRPGGPVLFRDPDTVLYGDLHSIRVLDKRASKKVSYSISPDKACVSLTSYADTGIDFASLACSSHMVGAFGGNSNVVQLFDIRAGSKLLDEWALPGRGMGRRTANFHLEFFPDTSRMYVSGSPGLEGYVIGGVGRSVELVPTARSLPEQTRAKNLAITREWNSRFGKHSKGQRSTVVSDHKDLPSEVHVGSAVLDAKILSVTNQGVVYVIESGAESAYAFSSVPSRKRFVSSLQEAAGPVESVSVGRVAKFLREISTKDHISALHKARTYKEEIPPIGQFFIHTICGIVGELRPCAVHGSGARAGSAQWCACVAACGFRVWGNRPKVRRSRRTSVGEIFFAFNEMFGAIVTPAQIKRVFRQVVRGGVPHFRLRLLDHPDPMQEALLVVGKSAQQFQARAPDRVVKVRAEEVEDDSDDSEGGFRPVNEMSKNIARELVRLKENRSWIDPVLLMRLGGLWGDVKKIKQDEGIDEAIKLD